MPRDPFVREKFTRERTATKKLAAEYFQRFPKDRYQTEIENWRHLQSQNIEFTMKRLREPVEVSGSIRKRPPTDAALPQHSTKAQPVTSSADHDRTLTASS